MRATKPAVFEATDRNAVTGVGAPSYVSGAHWWNGTAETLNAKPTMMRKMPAVRTGVVPPALTLTAMSPRIVVPVTP